MLSRSSSSDEHFLPIFPSFSHQIPTLCQILCPLHIEKREDRLPASGRKTDKESMFGCVFSGCHCEILF